MKTLLFSFTVVALAVLVVNEVHSKPQGGGAGGGVGGGIGANAGFGFGVNAGIGGNAGAGGGAGAGAQLLPGIHAGHDGANCFRNRRRGGDGGDTEAPPAES